MIKRLGYAIALCFSSTVVSAQGYPSKPIRLVVPFPPGGTVDITARAIAPALSEAMGQNIVVENRGGAAGMIGTAAVAKAAPDGYTLLLGSNSTLSVAPSLSPGIVQYNPVRDFTPISLVGSTPFVLVVHPSVPATTVKQFIALSKARRSELTMGSGGVGHLVGELFQTVTGTKFTHVPFQGTGPAGVALMGGQVDLMFDQLATSIGPIKGGRTRALGVSSPARALALPDVPTFREGGVANFELTSITGVLAPAGIPQDVLNKLHGALTKVVTSQAMKERFATFVLEPKPSSPQEFGEYIKTDLARWQKVVRDANIPTQ